MTETFQIDQPNSVIITLEPDPESRTALQFTDGVPDAIPQKEYHLTLIRVGDISATSQLSDILQVLLDVASKQAPMIGEVAGAGFFGKDGFNGNTVMLVDIDGLLDFRAELADALAKAKVKVDEEYDFIPHVAVAKGPVIAPESKVGTSLSFGNFGLRFGPQAAMVPFMLEPEPEVAAPAAPVPAAPAAPARPAAPTRPVQRPVPTPAGPNAAAVAALLDRLSVELGFLQGPDGKFVGSEPEGGKGDEKDIAAVKQGASVMDGNLTGASLSGADMESGNYSGSNFSNGDLSYANMNESICTGSVFTGADMGYVNAASMSARDADFSSATLDEGQFIAADLAGANFSSAGVTGTDFTNATLVGANFSSVTASQENGGTGVVLNSADAREADFSGANIPATNAAYADLSGANMSDANLAGSNMIGANLSGTNLSGADLTNADLTEAIHDEATVWPDGFTPPETSFGPTTTAAALLDRLVAEFGRFLQDEHGRFIGSEPEDGDKAPESADLPGALGNVNLVSGDQAAGLSLGDPMMYDVESFAAVDNFISGGGIEDAPAIAAACVPADEAATITIPGVFPETLPAFDDIEEGPQEFSMGTTYGYGDMVEAARGTNADTEVIVQVNVPEGHPVVPCGTRSDPVQGPAYSYDRDGRLVEAPAEPNSSGWGSTTPTSELSVQSQSSTVVLHPDTVFTTTGIGTTQGSGKEFAGAAGVTVIQVDASMPGGSGSASTSVESGATFERGEVIRGERGLLAGSEPGPMSDKDRAEGLGRTMVDVPQFNAVQAYLATGGEPMATDQRDTFLSAFSPADTAFTVTIPGMTADEIPGLNASEDSPQLGWIENAGSTGQVENLGVTEPVSSSVPQFTLSDESLVPIGYGSGEDASFETQNAWSGGVMVQVDVPEGHPVVNLGTPDKPDFDQVPSDHSTAVMLHPDTVFTPTSFGVTADSEMLVLSVTASMPEATNG